MEDKLSIVQRARGTAVHSIFPPQHFLLVLTERTSLILLSYCDARKIRTFEKNFKRKIKSILEIGVYFLITNSSDALASDSPSRVAQLEKQCLLLTQDNYEMRVFEIFLYEIISCCFLVDYSYWDKLSHYSNLILVVTYFPHFFRRTNFDDHIGFLLYRTFSPIMDWFGLASKLALQTKNTTRLRIHHS